MVRKRAGTTHSELYRPPATVPAASPARKSSLPPQVRFPLLVVLSFTISSSLYSLVSPFTIGDLATVTRSLDQWWAVAGLLAWKAAQLAVGWYGGYDSSDVAALTFLTHVPYLYFLTTFYHIRPTTTMCCIFIDTLAAYAPFYSLKVSSSVHSVITPRGIAANRSVINDFGVQTYISLLAASVYGVVVFGSFGSWLPVYLVTHFDGIKDISALHNANFLFLIASFVPVGFAAKLFLFTPSQAAKADKYDKETANFNPETATFGETLLYNLWGYSHRSRQLAKRTATLVAVGGLHTWLQTYATVEGAEALGAAGWSSVWALAATLTGVAFLWVGDV